ncbi:putative cytochrome P450 [Phaeosphaeriaceae sp. PMI808]|nr:putative cytochrome P450 [Phaeosphaeriaceae sp. PMI808]
MTFIPFLFFGAAAYALITLFKVATHPLGKVPGPWQARITRFWELRQVRANHFEHVNIKLHAKYGPIVRVSPNRYSINCPEAVQQIYGHGSKFTKDRWYRAYGHPDDAHADIFSVIDERRHAVNRRKVASLFSMTSMVGYEPYVDVSNATLVARFVEFASTGQVINVPDWMQYYAFDVVGEFTVSALIVSIFHQVGGPFGMMRTGGDIQGILDAIHQNLAYSSRMCLFNELHAWLGLLNHTMGVRSAFENINDYVKACLAERHKSLAENKATVHSDFIQRLIDLRAEGRIDDADVFNTINVNIAAGSDTTGLTLSAAIYYLCRNPSCAKKLRTEIDEAASQGKISEPITFAEANNLPYLQAVIKETFRIHPGVGMTLPRVVPPGGAEIAGTFFPEGTVVGMNAWVLHRDENIFGPDAHLFRPERWLGTKEEVAPLERNLFTFGAGSRTCIGKNISLLELTKLIPQLYRRFDFELENGEWETQNVFFVKPSFQCKVVLR